MPIEYEDFSASLRLFVGSEGKPIGVWFPFYQRDG